MATARSKGPDQAGGPQASNDDCQACKRWGHQWDALDGPPLGLANPETPGFPEWLRCVRCHTAKVTMISTNTGYVLRSTFHYADAYRSVLGGDSPTKQELRATHAHQQLRSRLRSAS